MASDLNRVFLIGRLTHDPELRYTPNGTGVSDLRMATSRVYTTRDGDRREDKLFIDVTVWNRQAETCCQYLKKGRLIHVEGYLKMDSWEDRNTGEKRTKIKVEADRVLFLDSGRRDDGDSTSGRDDFEEHNHASPPGPRASGAPDSRAGHGVGAAQGSSSGPVVPRQASAPDPEDGADEDIPF